MPEFGAAENLRRGRYTVNLRLSACSFKICGYRNRGNRIQYAD
jgi:hypothetical protein